MCESHLLDLVIIFFLLLIAISPAELTQLRDNKLHSVISWVSSTEVFVMFHWLAPAQPSCKLWDSTFLQWEQNLQIAGVLLTYVTGGVIPLLERKSLSVQDSAKVAIWTAHIWLTHWIYLKCKSQKGIAGFMLPLFSMQHINRKPVYCLNAFFIIKLLFLFNSVCSLPVNIWNH